MPEDFFDVPVEEIAEFQSFIYDEWGQVNVEVEEVNEHLTLRRYFGECEECGDKYLLGYIKIVDDEPVNLYVPKHGPQNI